MESNELNNCPNRVQTEKIHAKKDWSGVADLWAHRRDPQAASASDFVVQTDST